MFLIFDTETTGLPKRWDAPLKDAENWPRCVQIAWQLHDAQGKCVEHQEFLIQPDGYTIPYDSEQVHGISTALAEAEGIPLKEALELFSQTLQKAQFVGGHNVGFDLNIMGAEYLRVSNENPLENKPLIDTCTEETATLCALPGGRGGKFKLPTLTELYFHLFNENFEEAHNSSADVEATTRCFLELLRTQQINPSSLEGNPKVSQNLAEALPAKVALIGLKHKNLKSLSQKLKTQEAPQKPPISTTTITDLSNTPFVHLHNHSQFSVLQATSRISQLVSAAAKDQMPALALTDHGNLMGAFHFVKAIKNHNNNLAEGQQPIKPIIGCEFYVCDDHTDRTRRDDGYQIVLLAKNKNGYKNLSKMTSLAYTKGFYYVPRIDKEIVKQYHQDLIALTGNLYGEVPSKILNVGDRQAEDALLWWESIFGDDLYIELMRHHQENEDRANLVLLDFSKKHNIPIIATNNTYYVEQEEANAHDILLCVKEGEKQATPIGRGRGYRYGFPNQEYYFKSQEAMKALFRDLPEAIENIGTLIDKIVPYELQRDVLLPKFDIPKAYQHTDDDDGKKGENDYLRFLTYEGAKKRYPQLDTAIKERLDFELEVIANTGYPGYFLIVQDFIAAARKMGVSVGPGRGSAAGSAVAYCLGITNLDPIQYDLLFERFLNPDRVSLPDIDIDFDDEGRAKVMDYVIEKYGSNQVAQIITYGTMAAKSSIRDTARVLDLSLGEADRISKMVPNIKLNKLFSSSENELKETLRSDEFSRVKELREMAQVDDLAGQTLQQAQILEGSLRNTGIHACGVIITPDDITEFVPIATAKDSDLFVTQFDNAVVEDAGLLKMDFLGLKTLTLIKDTVKLVKYKHGIDLDPDNFPLDDTKTYELFQRGETVGIFQYESAGMQKYLKELKPTVFADLIAMNALYRPGPLEYIPSFINRKNGSEAIAYDLPAMEEYLQETYGITVYQEQVMLLSQKLAGFTKGEADVLRKAMGKKIFELLNKLKPKFIDGGVANGHPQEILEKIWRDWEAFASYAFNKSHSTCYAWIGYQTAYLKAHYPAEYMAAVLSNNMNDIKQVTFFMEECKRMGLNVLGPDVNESFYKFTVNDQKAIRFGMGAIKGVGKGAVDTIIAHREQAPYQSIFDLVKRVDLRAANKKALENLVLAGGLDSFDDTHRAQYLNPDGEGISFLEKVLRFGSKYQEQQQSSQTNLFGDQSDEVYQDLVIPQCESWNSLEMLKREKEVVGIYLSAHPLDDFKKEIKHFTSAQLDIIKDLEPIINRELHLAGIINSVEHLQTKNGKQWAKFNIEDFSDQQEFRIFSEDYLKFRHFLVANTFVRFRVAIREGWINHDTGKRGAPRLQFLTFESLQETIDKNSKKITLQLDIHNLNEETVSKIEEQLKTYRGDKHLAFDIYDPKEKIKLTLNSRKTKVNICPELLDYLDNQQWPYRLN
ncbi:MAG: DNA polymerase III subunit alpha [Bacteroidetes bacterium]|nr:DNA polymerase III subunit alpha [Bacteroidota bacterium]MDA0938439.1 DNA polymerase III subunit alpha [Bacteroidota bacterium]MDA1345213.1 DNA polymerase III subunit alpha [Bacteroidota bacterium]